MRLAKCLSLLCLILLVGSTVYAQSELPFRIIVNADNDIPRLSRVDAANVFLKRVQVWETEDTIIVVDQTPTSPVRRSFTREILKRDVGAVRTYWTQVIYSGLAVPPTERRTDSEVIEFVAMHPTAVGYVSARTRLPEVVREVPLR
jgi:ABC-type phosphate transport system substrate-binding protein